MVLKIVIRTGLRVMILLFGFERSIRTFVWRVIFVLRYVSLVIL